MSVEAYVISALVAEGTPKKAFSAGITEADFEMHDEEWKWIVSRAEKKKPINIRHFRKAFPEFDFIKTKDTLPDLLDELKSERAYLAISSAIEEVFTGEDPLNQENAIEKAQQLREILGEALKIHSAHSDVLIKSGWEDHYHRVKELMILRDLDQIPGIPTGIPHFDHHWGGLQGETGTLVLGRPGDAKALDISTPIPTPDGWKTIGELQQGDEVFDELGQVCTVQWRSEIWLGDCYRVNFSDGSSVIADSGHLWETYTRSARRYEMAQVEVNTRKDRPQCNPLPSSLPQVRSTSEIAETLYCDTADGRLNHSIRNALPIDLPDQDLLVDPYVLGVWLGDGTTVTNQITTADAEIIERINAAGYETTAFKSGKRGKAQAYTIHGLRPQLRALGVLGQKRIPVQYLRASYNQRLELLRGLMDTDGTWHNRSVMIGISNKRLAQDVYELIVSLGMMPYKRQVIPMLNGKKCAKSYQLKFSPLAQVFGLSRKAIKYQPERGQENRRTHRYITSVIKTADVPVCCISVDSSSRLFLAGKQMVPTHNSFTLAKFATEGAWAGYRMGFFSPEMTTHQHYCRFHTLLSAKPEIQKALGLRGSFRNRSLKDGRNFNLKTYHRFLKYLEEQMAGEILLFTRKYRREKMGVGYIRSRVEEYGLHGVIVDPIYKLKPTRNRGAKWEELQDIVDGLMDLAHEFDIPVVMSNQASRALAGSKGDAPDKDSSFGADAPVQEADTVLGVRHFSDEHLMKYNCSKNRHGERFKFSAKFIPNVGVLEDITPLKGDYANGYDPEKAEELSEAMREAGVQ